MIVFPKGETKVAMNLYDKLRSSEEEFSRHARQQAIPSLAAKGGVVPAFGRHATGSNELERAAFSLQPGEVSQIVGTPEGEVVIKCDKRIPPDGTQLKDVRAKLEQEIIEKKLRMELIPKVMAELKEEAKPKLFLKKVKTQEEWLEEIRQQDAEAERLLGPAAKQPPGR
jgi:hypothetical protein